MGQVHVAWCMGHGQVHETRSWDAGRCIVSMPWAWGRRHGASDSHGLLAQHPHRPPTPDSLGDIRVAQTGAVGRTGPRAAWALPQRRTQGACHPTSTSPAASSNATASAASVTPAATLLPMCRSLPLSLLFAAIFTPSCNGMACNRGPCSACHLVACTSDGTSAPPDLCADALELVEVSAAQVQRVGVRVIDACPELTTHVERRPADAVVKHPRLAELSVEVTEGSKTGLVSMTKIKVLLGFNPPSPRTCLATSAPRRERRRRDLWAAPDRDWMPGRLAVCPSRRVTGAGARRSHLAPVTVAFTPGHEMRRRAGRRCRECLRRATGHIPRRG